MMLPIQPANRKKATPVAKYSGQDPAKMRVAKDTTILVFKIPKIAVDVRLEITVSALKFDFLVSLLMSHTPVKKFVLKSDAEIGPGNGLWKRYHDIC